ncbi:hypothetical protein [Rubrivirga sp.]|uniref:hypothetical protein n=1 Tax=Rubrivirga sp. TaxID=1885344 RepID=UPI003B517C0A
MTPAAFDRALLAGLAFGAGLGAGLLLAPAPGDATRRRLARSARGAADVARDRTAGLAEPLADAARDRARRLSERHLPLAGDLDVIDARDVLADLHAGRS